MLDLEGFGSDLTVFIPYTLPISKIIIHNIFIHSVNIYQVLD